MDLTDDPTYPLFPVLTLSSFFLVLVPLPWHIQAANVGTCAYIFWASLACLLEFINSLIWRNSILNLAPVWCDISSKILLGAGIGIPAAGLCISRRLYTISAIKSTVITRQDKRRAVIIDSCIAFGIPVLVMALHYIVQGHRFDILEDVGCYPNIYNTLPAYFLVFMWPTLLGSVSFVLSALTLYAFYKRRLEFSQFLSTHSSLSSGRYIRLMMLAISEMMCTVPISIYSIYISNKGVQLQPWISWADTHYDFSYVGQIPAFIWMGDPNYRISVELTRWLFPGSAFLFFLLFGFGTEARKNYRAAFWRVAKFLRCEPASQVSVHVAPRWKAGLDKNISVGSLPIYVAATSPRAKHCTSFTPSAQKRFEIDVEKAAGCPSPSLTNGSPRDLQPSPTATLTGGETNKCSDTVTNGTSFANYPTNCHTIPACHRPFSLPSVCPVPSHPLQGSQSFDSVRITVQTQCSAV